MEKLPEPAGSRVYSQAVGFLAQEERPVLSDLDLSTVFDQLLN